MSDLSSLPIELIEMVSTSLDDADILNLRSQSRTLRNGTTFEFCRRFLKTQLEVIGSRASFRSLTRILRNPDFSSAKAFPQALAVYDPVESDMTSGDKSILPTAKDIDRLLATLPRLQTLTIRGIDIPRRDADNRTEALQRDQENLAPAVLKGLVRAACPELQLTKLSLYSCALDGALLIETLFAFEHSLSEVGLRKAVLFGGLDRIKWHDVFLVLFRLDLMELILEDLNDDGRNGLDQCIMLHDDTFGMDDFWLSYDTRATTMTKIKRRANGDVGYTGCAEFTRHYARLTESYVELGLRKLRKGPDLKLYYHRTPK
jgi:hypothetical protein